MARSTLPTTPRIRCSWPKDDPLMVRYHDREWGKPVHSDRKMFEFLILETFQAGLSWRTVLHKRQNFKKAFANFDYHTVATFTNRDVERLVKDAGIIRNRQKIVAAIRNAKALIEIRKHHQTFARYMWQFTNHRTLQTNAKTSKDIPAITPLAITIAKDLKAKGFSFLGPTVVYAHMQAVGMVNDHIVECYRWKELRK